jgi:hypothetical protein
MQSTAWIFPLYFQFPYLLEETCFQQEGSSAVEGTSQAILGSSDQPNILASLSLFLKSEKIPALLYEGKGPKYRPFVFFDLFPWPTTLGHRSQITHQALLLYIVTTYISYLLTYDTYPLT